MRVVIIDDVPSTVDNLKKLLSFEPDVEVVGTALNAEAAIEEVRRLGPDVVLMDVNMPGLDGIKATQAMAAEPPHAPVILMSVQEDREYLRRAMQAGAREFLVKPFSGEELAAALRRVHQLEKLRRAAPPATVVGTASEPAAATATVVPAAGAPTAPATTRTNPAEGRIITVFSGKGGSGKSLLAVNLAAAFAKDEGRRTALVDLDLQFGDLGVMLGLESGRNIYQVVEAFPNVDAEFLDALMPKTPGDFRVLLGPQSPEFADLVTGEHARTILQILQSSFDVVVVDTSSHLGEVTLEALERARYILVVVDLSLPAVKEAKLALRVFQRLGIPNDRIKVVLNRADFNLGITLAQVESSLEIKVAAEIPADPKTLLKSVQRAEPFVTLEPRAPISQRVRELAISLVPLHAADGSRTGQPGKRAGFWSRTSAG